MNGPNRSLLDATTISISGYLLEDVKANETSGGTYTIYDDDGEMSLELRYIRLLCALKEHKLNKYDNSTKRQYAPKHCRT